MKPEARHILATLPFSERQAFIDEAIIAHHQQQLPTEVRQILLMEENKRLIREAGAREAYILELEELLDQKEVITPAPLPQPVVPTVSIGRNKLEREYKRLRQAYDQAIYQLTKHGVTVPPLQSEIQ